MYWGKNLKKLRIKKGLTQTQLAEDAGITHGTISKLETGYIKELNSDSLKRIAKVLGVTTDYLLGIGEELSPRDVVALDADAEYIVTQYAKLSANRRQQLRDFVDFLVKQETSSI